MWICSVLESYDYCFATFQGKTLAFVLPVLESLTNGPAREFRKTGYGRPPTVIVLLPTRELAKQVIFIYPGPYACNGLDFRVST